MSFSRPNPVIYLNSVNTNPGPNFRPTHILILFISLVLTLTNALSVEKLTSCFADTFDVDWFDIRGGFRSWGNCDWIMKCAKILKRDLVCSLRGSNLDMLIADIQVFTADRFNPGDRVLAKTNHPASIGCFTLGYIIQQTSADTFHVKFYNGVERKNCERHEIRPLLHPLFPTDISTIAEIDPSPNKLHRNAQDFLWYLNNIDRTGLSLYTLWIRSAVRFTINNEFIRNMHIDKRPNQEHLHSLQQYLLRRRSGIEQEKKMYNLDDGEYLGFFRSDWSTKFLPDQFCLNFKRHLYSWLNYEICEITRRRSQDGPEPKI